VQLAKRIGTARAAAQLGVKRNTLAAWVSREKRQAEEAALMAAGSDGQIDRLDKVVERMISALEKQAQNSKTAEQAAKAAHLALDLREKLARARREDEAHRVYVDTEREHRVTGVITVGVDVLGLAKDATQGVFGDLMAKAAAGEPLQPDQALVDRAREANREVYRPEIEAELREQLKAEQPVVVVEREPEPRDKPTKPTNPTSPRRSSALARTRSCSSTDIVGCRRRRAEAHSDSRSGRFSGA
jgi:uncharacterized protein (UPF0218 family)